jgi:predicted TIM-barrel fold metal-dependent hydrolase
MIRRRRIPKPYFFLMAIALLLVVGRYGDPAITWLAGEPELEVLPSRYEGMTSIEALQEIQAAGRIINVHEHVQGLSDAERLLEVMDRLGVEKSLLMGSSWFTVTLDERVGFTRYDENNEALLEIVEAYPGRFEAWPTLNPEDEQKLEKLKDLHARGAAGVKLYTGHGYVKRSDGQYMFHTMPLDDPAMLPVYEYCQENFIPLLIHVQTDPKLGPGIAEEFIAVLTQYPDMKVICPHYMLSSGRDSRLREFLDTFPNLYSDISYGHDSFIQQGFARSDKNPEKFRRIFREYPDRFMWATDLVVTDIPSKSVPWIEERFQGYLDMLTQEAFTTVAVPGKALRGLELDPALLEGILYRNYHEFMAKRPKDTRITRSINWSKMGGSPTGRKPGEILPPPRKK